MELLRIAYSGFKKYRKRRKNLTVILIGSYFLCYFFISLFTTINNNLWTYWVKDFIGGDIIVSQKLQTYDIFTPISPDYYFDYLDFLKANRTFDKPQVSPRLRVGALLENKNSDNSVPCIVIGVDLQTEKKLNDYIQVDEGRLFDPSQNEMVIPESVASNINAKIGDQIVMYVKTKEGYLNYNLVKVVGFLSLSSASSYLGQNIAYMPISQVRDLTMSDDNTVSELLYVKKGIDIPNRGSGYKVINALNSFSIVRSLSLAFGFLVIIIFLLIFSFSLSSIYNNVTIMSAERYKEIGVYLTYGAKPYWIWFLLLLELVIYTLYCSLFGGLFSLLVVVGINNLGLYPIDMPTEMLMSSSHFIMKIGPSLFISAFLILLCLVILGGLRPIWSATGNIRVSSLFSNND